MKRGRRTPPGARPTERKIRELSVATSSQEPPQPAPDSPRPAVPVVVFVAVVAVAALAYGFLLGRGSGSTTEPPSIVDEAPTTTEPLSTSTSAPAERPADRLPESFVSFVREHPGHDLGIGVGELLGRPEFETIAVDAAGLVWAGGSTGLMRLDPTTATFSRLTRPDGTGPLDIQAIAPEPGGSVWVATGRGLSHWDGEAWANNSRILIPDDRDLYVAGLAVAEEGEVWLATHQWDADGTTEISQIHHKQAPFVGDVATTAMPFEVLDIAATGANVWALAGGRLWLHTGFWELVEIAGLPWQEGMAVADDGAVWLAAGDRLRRWDGSELVEIAWNPPWADPEPPSESGESEVWIQQLAAGLDGSVWGLVHRAGGFTDRTDSALVRFDGAAAMAHNLPDLPEGWWSRDLAIAPNGDVWIAASSRLLRLDRAGWSEFSTEDDPPFEWISSLAAGPGGDVWLAGARAIVHATGTEFRSYGAEELGLSESDTTEPGFVDYWVATDPTGGLWGGVGCRASRFSAGQWKALPPLPEAPPECWGTLARGAPDGALWMGIGCCEPDRPIYRFQNGEWQLVGAESWAIDDLAFAEDGTVWAAGGSGITRYSDGEWLPVLSGESFSTIAAGADGSIWAALHPWADMSARLWRYHEGSWEVEASSRITRSLARGPEGTVWALQEESGGRTVIMNTATGRLRRVVENGDLSEMAITTDGIVWIGGNHRLYRVDPTG